MNQPVYRLPAALRQIPPLPQVALRAMALIRDPESSRTALAQVLSLDQGMTGRFGRSPLTRKVVRCRRDVE